MKADHIIKNAKIYTSDKNNPMASALVVKDGKFVYVGDEAGLKGILLYVGGNIVIGKHEFSEVEKRFKDMGFDRAFPPGTDPQTTIDCLKEDFHLN